ncbi:MAG: 4-hydroxy-tetrahydrodipicolinate synthase [Puniceicoccales bacterium]|jgi:4-hydroxy-tetrahydrodipicolinate synthase|nr:4-hydroxy-tetrahydrodipicolinate synthase [Puniceicoccales bacterium]
MSQAPDFSGTYTALVTPFRSGKLDLGSFGQLLATQEELEGVVIGGTTGESPTLDEGEWETLIREAQRQRKNPKLRIIAGTGSNVTTQAIRRTELAERLGVEAILVVTPYYNKPSQEGLFRHFSAIAAVTRRPILLYSVPSRCGIEIAVETVARLREAHPHIVGIKEASEQCSRVDGLRAALGEDFSILSGNDALTLPFMALGANGVISVASNLCPHPIRSLVRSLLRGDIARARLLHQALSPLFHHLFIESNPAPIKQLLARQRLIASGELRLPLVALAPAHAQALENTFADFLGASEKLPELRPNGFDPRP